MSFDLQTWYNEVSKGNVVLAYKGDITSELITQILDTVEEKLTEKGERNKLKRKIYNVLVEALQNLYHHVDAIPEHVNEEKTRRFGIIVFKEVEDGVYTISTGNFVERNRIKLLKDRLDQINYLAKDELKSLYRMILDNQEFSTKGGGGLGMIDIARRTGKKLDYKFYTIDQNMYFFSLTIKI